MTVLVLVALAVLGAVGATVGPSKKLITDLPGLKHAPNFKQYSGFLKASESTYLHYWFVEAQKDRASSPTVLWLNGGPGCSSVGGLLEELGPFLVQDDAKTLLPNPWSWNTNANLLIFESPAGVGFSYSTEFNVSTGDYKVADENYNALKEFFNIFPEYRRTEFYITGESYAGIYIPMLATKILDGLHDYKINLKGIAIGNGMVHKDLNTNTLMKFAYWHGLIDENLYDTLVTSCCGGCADNCNWHNTTSPYCKHYVDVNNLQVWLGGLNTYDVNRYCTNPGQLSGWEPNSRFLTDLLGLADENVLNKATGEDVFTLDPNKLDHATIEKLVDLASPCMNETALTMYMRRDDVKEALGIPSFVTEYTHCSKEVGTQYRKEVLDVSSHIHTCKHHGVRVLLYYGDTDMACNFLMGQHFSEQLQYKRIEEKRPWYYDNQIEGFVTRFEGLDFLTVKGVGHMVPQWKPAPAFYMIDKFLKNQPY